MTALRIGFISQWFSPEPTVVPDGIATALRSRGFEVGVLTGAPNYPSGVVHDGYSPGRVRRDVVHGLQVLRTPLYPSHDQSTVRRILNYTSWSISASIFGQRFLKRSQLNVVYGSPITAALPAQIARLLWRRPFVLIVQDVWPDSVFATGFLTRGLLGRVAHRVLTRYCSQVYRHADHIVVISPGMKRLLVSRGVPAEKVTVVYNWVEEDSASSATPEGTELRSELALAADDFVLMYAGNHGPAQALGSLLEAMTALPDDSRAHLVLIGDGVEKEHLQEVAKRVAPTRVHFLAPRPKSAMGGLMRSADVQVVSLSPDPLFSVTVPSKLQSIMAAGHPVLAVADGDVRDTVRHSGCGVTAEPGRPDAIVSAIRELETSPSTMTSMGDAGRAYYAERMSRPVGAAAYADVVDRVIEGEKL